MSFNFNRRPKRVAGPGFFINCRFDDFSISKMRGKLGVTDPSSFVPPARSSECYDIKEQEILVTMKENNSYHDGHVHVLSCINGIDVKTANKMNANAVKEDILNRVQFIGLALTEFKSDNKAYMEQGLVATVGGVETILNDGEDDINPGDLVELDLNFSAGRSSTTRNRGIPREKVRFCVKKADDDLTTIQKCMEQACGTDANSLADLKAAKEAEKVARVARDKVDKTDPSWAGLNATVQNAKNEVIKKRKSCSARTIGSASQMKDFLKLYRLHNERVIGKAMSFARKGDRFEILLSLRHAK